MFYGREIERTIFKMPKELKAIDEKKKADYETIQQLSISDLFEN